MYKDPYIIVSVGRSGSSALAGMMYYLGMHMGDNFVPADRNNPGGHWEDKNFKELNLAFIKEHISEDEFLDKAGVRINKNATEHYFWGFKVPSTAQILDKYMEISDPKLIWCKRPKKEVIDSMKRAYGWDKEQAEFLYNERMEGIKKHFKNKDLAIDHKEIMTNPESVVEKLIEFTGISPLPEQKERAISHITKDVPPKSDKTKVLVMTPNGGSIRREVAYKLLETVKDGRYLVSVILPQGGSYNKNINKAIQETFLPGGYDFLLNIDADNPPLGNPLDLIQLNKDVMGFPTPQWSGEIIYPVAMDKVPKIDQYKSLPPEKHQGLQEVDVHGSGCILIARRVIEAVNKDENGPVWKDIWNETGTERTTADYNFCDRARENGFKVWSHFDYGCDHIKNLSMQDMLNYASKRGKYWG